MRFGVKQWVAFYVNIRHQLKTISGFDLLSVDAKVSIEVVSWRPKLHCACPSLLQLIRVRYATLPITVSAPPSS
jgi:hypothetical protein